MNESFGQYIKELRRNAQISQRELARLISVDFSYISKVENDRLPPPSADTALAIARALKVSPGELLARTGKIPSDIEKTLATNVEAQEFIREIHKLQLSDDEWKEIRKSLSRLREVK